LEQKGPALKDADTLQAAGLKSGDKLYLKDLGPQDRWSTVFLAEYAGPLLSIRGSTLAVAVFTVNWRDVVVVLGGCRQVSYLSSILNEIDEFSKFFKNTVSPLAATSSTTRSAY